MNIKLCAEGFLWKNQKAYIEILLSLKQKMIDIYQFMQSNVEKPMIFDYFIYYQSNRIINFDQTIEEVIYDKRYPPSSQKKKDDFQKLNNQSDKESEQFSVRQLPKEFLIKFQIEYVDEKRTEMFLTTMDDSLSSILYQFKLDRDKIEKILVNGVEYKFSLDDYDIKFSEFPYDDDVIKIVVSNKKVQNKVQYNGIITLIIMYDKQQINIETERDQTFDSILRLQKIPTNSKLSLCQSGQNVLDKSKQVGYYGMDNGWIIYVI